MRMIWKELADNSFGWNDRQKDLLAQDDVRTGGEDCL